MALKDALNDLNELFKDLSSLHVQTYTGTVNFTMDDDNKTKVDQLRDAVKNLPADGTVKLVAEAFYEFDGDSYNFLTSDDVPTKAIELHKAAVEAGMKTRQGLMELVKDAFD